MDLAIVISVIALVVSGSISIITLLLSEFRGPNISLLNEPEFEVNDENFDETRTQDYIPYWFRLKPVSFVFANHGGKSGTILDIKIDFVPNAPFKHFFERLNFSFDMPVTIKEGNNQPIKTEPSIDTVKWKEIALVKALDPNLTVDEMVTKAVERSKEEFEKFCEFLDKSEELGKVSCAVTLTKGRFRTKVKTEKLLENVTVANRYDKTISALRNCLRRWENLATNKAQLSDKVRRDSEELIRELKNGFSICSKKVDEKSISQSKLRRDSWKRLQQARPPHERRIRWFLIKGEEGLKEDLTELYEEIVKYNNIIEAALYLGDLRADKHFQEINRERERLHSNIEKMLERLSDLHERYV